MGGGGGIMFKEPMVQLYSSLLKGIQARVKVHKDLLMCSEPINLHVWQQMMPQPNPYPS